MKEFSPLLAFWRSVSCDAVAFLWANTTARWTPKAFLDASRRWEMTTRCGPSAVDRRKGGGDDSFLKSGNQANLWLRLILLGFISW